MGREADVASDDIAAPPERVAGPETTGTDTAFQVEQHGIDPIPLTDRHGHPRELFSVWFAANLIFTYVILGALVIGFGLGFWAAVAAVVVGHLFYILLGFGALSGPRAGTATIVVSRSAFGVFGNAPAVFLSWITVVGWQAVNVVIGTLVLFELAKSVGLPGSTATKVVAFLLLMIVTYGVAVWGHATIVVMNTVFSIALGVGTIVLVALVVPDANWTFAGSANAGIGAWLLAVLVVAAAPFSYMNYPADYTRYLEPGTPQRPIILNTAIGSFIPAVVITMVGVIAATATDMTDPIAGISKLVPGWFLDIYYLVIVGGTITNNFLNSYSSGLNLQALGVRIARHRAVLIDAVIAGAMSIYALFVFNFVDSFTQFLSLMVLWIAPWTGIYLTDMWLRRTRYDMEALHRRGGGAYWYRSGWNPVALVALVLGTVVAALFANSTLYVGPLVGLIDGGDISIFAGFLVAATIYYAGMRGKLAEASR